jgi:hypothetical protein
MRMLQIKIIFECFVCTNKYPSKYNKIKHAEIIPWSSYFNFRIHLMCIKRAIQTKTEQFVILLYLYSLILIAFVLVEQIACIRTF